MPAGLRTVKARPCASMGQDEATRGSWLPRIFRDHKQNSLCRGPWVGPKPTNNKHTAQSSQSHSAPETARRSASTVVHWSQVSSGSQGRSLRSIRSNGYREYLRDRCNSHHRGPGPPVLHLAASDKAPSLSLTSSY